MPAPLHQSNAAPNRISSSTSKDNYLYPVSMGSISNVDRGGYNGRQGAPANTTSNRNPNSMYNAMSIAWGKETSWLQEEQKIIEESTIIPKTKKAAQSSARPSTPHGNRNKNFIEKNKQFVQATPKTTSTKKTKEDNQNISPCSSPKPKPSILQNRPVTSSTNGQSSARPQATKPNKKKNDAVKVTSNSNGRRPMSPPMSPTTSATNAAHLRSHAHGHAQVRTPSPEKSLREENRKLKRQVNELEELLREKEFEVSEYEDVVEDYQERIRQVEARNRELHKENEFMRSHIKEELEEKQKASPTNIISSVMSNIQRIRGESSSPTAGLISTSPIPAGSPNSSPVLEILKAHHHNDNINKIKDSPISPTMRPRVVPRVVPRGNLIPSNNVSTGNNNDHPPRPTAPSPASMNRQPNHPSSFTGGLRQAEMSRKQAAALNVVMEDSEDSEVDDFFYEHEDYISDDQADSEFDVTTSSESENEESEFDSRSTYGSSKLDQIVEEGDEDEEEFEFESSQQKNLAASNPVSPVKHSFIQSKKSPRSNDSGFGEIVDKNDKQKTSQDSAFNPHRDSMSSIKSNSSTDSSFSISSSQNDSYLTSVTSDSDSNDSFNSKKLGHSKNGSSSNINQSNNNNDLAKNDLNVKRSNSPQNLFIQSNSRSTSPTVASTRASSPTSSTRASTPSSNASTARAPSPPSVSSSRASTPSESSRNANKCATAIPPPPPPPTTKDPLATLQHYLRLIQDNSVMENPQRAYNMDKVIDEGSSSKVYTAHPVSNPNEEVAIKIVPLQYSLEFIFNEIYVLKNLKHENIVGFKESFLRWDGKTREVWIAMEKCVRGDVTSRAGKINQREVGRIAGDLLSALKHLHSHGVIHRDIKLSNILAGNNNEIKLADFGISSLTPTSTTAMVGTIPYMAPDVVLVGADRPYDTKADIWSLGVCILELLTGKAAWGRIRDDEILDKLRKCEMPSGFQRLRKKADIGWEAIDFLEKCFAKTPENRWSAEKLFEHPFITGNRNN